MYRIKANSEIEKQIIDLHLKKLKLEGSLEELNRSLGYMDRIQWHSRKIKLEQQLENINSLLACKKPILIPEGKEEIEQFLILIQ